ncbi:hypothetical protein [Stenotrophomonas maltophilia]|uniref:hypothetical protein n=1 Tax=Stenotrophomonas maltophilia TaxID=40324 RepID=UPI001F53C72C|nr:hypothetical protein [Stenotrophomonas maltophilia]MCI1122227.1 hypothetical protein [Stenotrophomonas maltophilia]
MNSRAKIRSTAAKRKSQRPDTPQDAQAATAKNEATFANFKDQIELMKVLALGTGMCTAAYVLAASELAVLTRIVGAMTCMTLGVWIGVCGVLVYFRNRLNLSGLSVGQRVWRVAQYLVVMCATLFAFSTAVELAKLKVSGVRAPAATSEAL